MDNRTNVKQEEPSILRMFDEKLEEVRCLKQLDHHPDWLLTTSWQYRWRRSRRWWADWRCLSHSCSRASSYPSLMRKFVYRLMMEFINMFTSIFKFVSSFWNWEIFKGLSKYFVIDCWNIYQFTIVWMYVLTYTDFQINERQTPSDLNIDYWYWLYFFIFLIYSLSDFINCFEDPVRCRGKSV